MARQCGENIAACPFNGVRKSSNTDWRRRVLLFFHPANGGLAKRLRVKASARCDRLRIISPQPFRTSQRAAGSGVVRFNVERLKRGKHIG